MFFNLKWMNSLRVRLRARISSSWLSRRERSLVGRLLTLLFVGALSIYLVAIGGLWWTGSELVEETLRKQAIQWLSELDELGTPLYVTSQPERLFAPIATRLKRFQEIGFVRYYDTTGNKVLGEYTTGADFPAFTPAQIKKPATNYDTPYRFDRFTDGRNREYIRVTAPIRIRSISSDGLLDFNLAQRASESTKTIGFIDFGLDPGYRRADYLRSMIAGSMAIAVIFFIAALLGWRYIQRAMAPLLALQEPLGQMARGDIDIDIAPGGDREIAAISEALKAAVAAVRERDQALQRAENDAVTGLANREYFIKRLEIERSRVDSGQMSGAVILINIDRFDRINDSLGRSSGNRLLRQIAALLRVHVREHDLVSRFDGAEFVALIRNVNREGAIRSARTINQVVREFQFVEGDQSFTISCSIGIAMIEDAHMTSEEIMVLADSACYQARMRGGNGYFLPEVDEPSIDRKNMGFGWSKHVAEAIQNNRFKLAYQPILTLSETPSDEMYEVLLRLAGNDGELITPSAFLPIADRSGLLLKIDYWVIGAAFEALAELRARGRKVTFFVNLSGQVFEQGDALLSVVAENLERHRLPGSALVFEITEQAAVQHMNHAGTVIEGINALGCRFALDDFGSGFSSLSYLKNLPVSFLKIAGTFVQNLSADNVDQAMVKSIIQFAQVLGKQTIAESVQDRAALRLLSDFGVDFAQGFFLGRPMEQIDEHQTSINNILTLRDSRRR